MVLTHLSLLAGKYLSSLKRHHQVKLLSPFYVLIMCMHFILDNEKKRRFLLAMTC